MGALIPGYYWKQTFELGGCVAGTVILSEIDLLLSCKVFIIMEKRNKIIYWIATGLLTALAAMNVVVYLTQYDMVAEAFAGLGFPTFLVYPLALAKALGIVAILSRKSVVLKEWAYAGFFFTFGIASMAHFNAQDGGFVAPLVAMAILLVSRYFVPKVFGSE